MRANDAAQAMARCALPPDMGAGSHTQPPRPNRRNVCQARWVMAAEPPHACLAVLPQTHAVQVCGRHERESLAACHHCRADTDALGGSATDC